jgi:hypothetical protein
MTALLAVVGLRCCLACFLALLAAFLDDFLAEEAAPEAAVAALGTTASGCWAYFKHSSCGQPWQPLATRQLWC